MWIHKEKFKRSNDMKCCVVKWNSRVEFYYREYLLIFIQKREDEKQLVRIVLCRCIPDGETIIRDEQTIQNGVSLKKSRRIILGDCYNTTQLIDTVSFPPISAIWPHKISKPEKKSTECSVIMVSKKGDIGRYRAFVFTLYKGPWTKQDSLLLPVVRSRPSEAEHAN